MQKRTIKSWQTEVDEWIKHYGVRYFDITTNTLLLAEECGEICRMIARIYGEQSFKEKKTGDAHKADLKIELADLLFVLTCICNQLDIDLDEAIDQRMQHKTVRDQTRHHRNQKLK